MLSVALFIYPVTLTVSDSNGASDTKTIQVDVVDKFVPIPVTTTLFM